jgi:uncharacterized protein YukE
MIVNSSRALILKKQFYEEGIMARIRVNTEDLKEKAKDFDSAAEAFTRAGDEIIAAAMAMPSYDGQLSGPARKAGYEIQSQARKLKTALSKNADSLRKAAQAFEDVDNQTVSILFENQASLKKIPPIPLTPGDMVGTKDFGYQITYENGFIVITLWCGGQSTRIVMASDDYYNHKIEILEFMGIVDNFWDLVSKSGYPWAVWQKLQEVCANSPDVAACLDSFFEFSSGVQITDPGDFINNLIMMIINENWDWTMLMWMISLQTGGKEGAIKIIKQAMQLKNTTCGYLFNKLKQLESPLIG